jgi:hypothetical protein
MQGTDPARAQAVQSTVEHRDGGGDAADVRGSAPRTPVQVVDPGTGVRMDNVGELT